MFLASEIQHFLLYYGLPLLKPFLHYDFFHHFALFTTAMRLLMKNSVALDDIDLAKDLLDSFCRLMKSCYGMSFLVIYFLYISVTDNQFDPRGIFR